MGGGGWLLWWVGVDGWRWVVAMVGGGRWVEVGGCYGDRRKEELLLRKKGG